MNASQGARSIVMSCEAPADERDRELGRFLVLFQFKDIHLLQRATEGGSFQREGHRGSFYWRERSSQGAYDHFQNPFSFFFMYVHIFTNDM